jgi:hypothetical protein
VSRIIDVASLVAQARQETDTVGSRNPPDSDLLGFCNREMPSWFDIITEAYSQDYNFTTATILTVAGVADYALPVSIYKLRFADLQFGPNGAKIPLQPYNEALRDSYSFGQPQYIQGGQTITLSYTPTCPVLQQYASLTFNSADGIDGIVFTAKAAGSAGLNVSIQFTTGAGGATTVTIGSTPYAVVVNLKTGGDTIQNVLAALAASAAAKQVVNAAALTLVQTDSFTAAMAQTNLGGTVSWDFVGGWESLIIAGMAMRICRRLDRDYSGFIGEYTQKLADIKAMAVTRDSGSSMEMKDYESERSMLPFAPPFMRTYLYRLQGNNLHLISTMLGA